MTNLTIGIIRLHSRESGLLIFGKDPILPVML